MLDSTFKSRFYSTIRVVVSVADPDPPDRDPPDRDPPDRDPPDPYVFGASRIRIC